MVAAAHLARDKELKEVRDFFLAPGAAESLGYGLGEGKMLFNTTDVVWQWVLSLAVIIASLLRLLVYIRRRRSQRFQTWEPAELALVRMLVVLITGRPVTVVMWKRINTLLLTLLLLALAVGFHKSFGTIRSGSASRPTDPNSTAPERSTLLQPDG